MNITHYAGTALICSQLFVGCSSDNDPSLSNARAGAGGTSSSGGTTAVAGAGAGAPTSSAGATSNGLAGSAGKASFKLGAALEFIAGTGEVPYAIGANQYGIHGSAFLARSPQGNTVTVGTQPGKICIKGSLDEVPNANYSQYWGVEIGFNLNQVASNPINSNSSAAGAAGVAGAAGIAGAGTAGSGTDNVGAGGSSSIALVSTAGAAGARTADVAEPWLPGTVIGFSYVIEGPTINLIRFKALPAGYDSALESSVFCKSVAATSGVAESSLFTEMKQYCWNATANVLVPTSAGFANISWQLPADVAVGARPFDWCLTDLRPILAQ